MIEASGYSRAIALGPIIGQHELHSGVAGHSSTKDEGSPSCASTASRAGVSALGLMTDFVVCVCVVCVALTDFALM